MSEFHLHDEKALCGKPKSNMQTQNQVNIICFSYSLLRSDILHNFVSSNYKNVVLYDY